MLPYLAAGFIASYRYGGLNGDFVPVCGGCHPSVRSWLIEGRMRFDRKRPLMAALFFG